jgi:hypothetical protein
MSRSSITNEKLAIGAISAIVCLLAIVFTFWYEPNAVARARIKWILLSESAPQQQLEGLKPFVQVGENIAAVNKRIAPRPDVPIQIRRPTQHAYGLGGANLELAYRADGTIVGIGRTIYGRNEATVWLQKPVW